MNLHNAQFAHEAGLQDMYDREHEDPPEVTDEHVAKAVEEYAATQPSDVYDLLGHSTWFREHMLEIVSKCSEFRKEVAECEDVQIAAQKLANAEFNARREADEYDRVSAAFED